MLATQVINMAIPGSNLIFKDSKDEQQEGLMETLFIGQTWQMRYLKLKAYTYGSIATATGMVCTATIDYLFSKWTDYHGIIDWLFTAVI